MRVAALLAACVAFGPAGLPRALATGDSGTYVSGGAAVVRANGQPVVDEGTVVCDNGNGVGVGGLCLGFGGGDAVRVADEAAGEDVAFQVCVDNSGDGVCTSPDFGPCADVVVFSHDDGGNFFNPVGPVPIGFTPGCAGGPWKGYVVLLCEGTHVVGVDAHTHPATSGTGEVTSGGEGLGTFCGGDPQPSRKPYTLGSGARYVSGGTAVARADGQPAADEGAMTCNGGDNVGVGGFCVEFGAGDAVAAFDAAAGEDVAFQVCVDNNGDGFCTTPDPDPYCPDQVAFSHDDGGAFYNPVGPLPTGFRAGCPGGPFRGYVVFLCEGTHLDSGGAHAHAATSGTGRVTTGGEGVGTFCGGSHVAPSRKRYADVSALDRPGVILPGFSPGDPCRLRTASDPGSEGGDVQTGTIEGGPVTGGDVGAPADGDLSLTCTVQVGSSTANGSNAAAASASGRGTAVLAPTLVSFVAPADVPIYLCAEVTDATGATYYYDDRSGTFGTDPSAECALALTVEAGGDAAETLEEMGVPAGDAVELASASGCPLLAQLTSAAGPVTITPEGDVYVNGSLVVDCPPYEQQGGSVQLPGARVYVV